MTRLVRDFSTEASESATSATLHRSTSRHIVSAGGLQGRPWRRVATEAPFTAARRRFRREEE
jgi:hypothetical protein